MLRLIDGARLPVFVRAWLQKPNDLEDIVRIDLKILNGRILSLGFLPTLSKVEIVRPKACSQQIKNAKLDTRPVECFKKSYKQQLRKYLR